jgi:hypothetical protein
VVFEFFKLFGLFLQLVKPENQFIVLFLEFLIVLDELDLVIVFDQFPLLHVGCQFVRLLPFPLKNPFEVLNVLRLQFLPVELFPLVTIFLVGFDEVFEQDVVFEHFFAFALQFKDFMFEFILLCCIHIS